MGSNHKQTTSTPPPRQTTQDITYPCTTPLNLKQFTSTTPLDKHLTILQSYIKLLTIILAQQLVLVGETVTKECHPGRACRCDCPAHTADSDVSSNTWCTRKNLCVPRNWAFQHATRILDVIMLEYPALKVRPMPGIWGQSVPVTAIPWGGMNTE